MNENILCEKCGEQMISIKDGRAVGMTCPHCGWGWVTSYFDPISTDNTDYSIFIKAYNPATTSNIKIIADIAGINFLQAKKLLSSGKDELVYKAKNEAASTMYKAQHVQVIAKRLKEADIAFAIVPDFPYEV